MALVRHLRIENFRGIKFLEWWPTPGINCLVGPGDSGKSTILEAIDLALSPRRYAALGGSDFYCGLATPITIDVTLGSLEDSLLNLEAYANFIRGVDSATKRLDDEPGSGLEPALTIRLTADIDLVPRWSLFAQRSDQERDSRDLSYKDRLKVAPVRLGPYATTHLSWGQRSILNRIGDEKSDASTALAGARSAAKTAFEFQTKGLFSEVLAAVEDVSRKLAIDIGPEARALLDVNLVSMGNGQIALHDSRDVPLRNLGLGSSRLLVAGLQRYSAQSAQLHLVDEIEHGLEPYRIAQLLYSLGSKSTNSFQTFMTTHSPVVLRELSSSQLHILRKPKSATEPHNVLAVGGDEGRQKTLRACAEAFLTPRVLVCEGKTEVGLVRGFDQYRHERNRQTLARCGVYAADGGGSEAVRRALVFSSLGYAVAFLRDADVSLSTQQRSTLKAAGIEVHEWAGEGDFETALFSACPDAAIADLLQIASDARSTETVQADIAWASGSTHTIDSCCASPGDATIRGILAKASTRKGSKTERARNWFKFIEPAERIGAEVLPSHWQGFNEDFRSVVHGLWKWVLQGQVPNDAA